MRPSRLSLIGLLLLIAFTMVSTAHADNTGKRLLRILDALAGPEDSSATTQPRQSQRDRREEERKRALITAIEPRMQAYYRAVAADDEAAIFAQYSWEHVRGPDMVSTRERVLRNAAWVKRQIDIYGGLRRVRLLEVTEKRYSSYEREADVIVELEFNNGKRDASARIRVAQEGTATRAEQWKLGQSQSSIPAVGLFEINAVAKTYQHALMVEQNVERVMELSVGGNARRIREYMERMQEQAEANGGLERIEVADRLDTMRISTDYDESLRGSGISVTYHYRNGKNSEYPISMRFVFDNGVWKVRL